MTRFYSSSLGLSNLIVAPANTNLIGGAEAEYYGAALVRALVAEGFVLRANDPTNADFLVYFAYSCKSVSGRTAVTARQGWGETVVRDETERLSSWWAAVSFYDLQPVRLGLPGRMAPYFRAEISSIAKPQHACTLVIPNMLMRMIKGFPGRSGETADFSLRLPPFEAAIK